MQRTTWSMPSSDDVTMTGKSRSCRSLLHLREHLEPVDLRHFHVEQQEIEAVAPQHLQRHAPVLGGRDAVALQLEIAREEQPVDLVVVGHQQPRTRASRLTHGASPSAPPRRARIRGATHRAA